MKKREWVVVDQFAGGRTFRVDGSSKREVVVGVARSLGVDRCISPKVVLGRFQDEVGDVYVDVATSEGWGPGARFEGQCPRHQVCFVLISV